MNKILHAIYIIFFTFQFISFFFFLNTFLSQTGDTEPEASFGKYTLYFAMSESTLDFFWRRLKLALCGVNIRRIIDNVEARHLAEWEQEQPLCLFLLTPLSRLIKYSAAIPRFPLLLPLLSLLSLTALLLLKIPSLALGSSKLDTILTVQNKIDKSNTYFFFKF